MNKRFVIGFTIVTVFFVLIEAMPRVGHDMYGRWKKGCAANMRTIEGAIELYKMEKGAFSPAKNFLEPLRKNGYLKTPAECPGSPEHRKGVYELLDNNGAVDIRCSEHGDLSKQEGEQKYKGALDTNFWTRFVIGSFPRGVTFQELFLYCVAVVIVAAFSLAGSRGR